MIFLWGKYRLRKIIRLETWRWDFPERVTCQFKGDRKRLQGVLLGKVAESVTDILSCLSPVPRAAILSLSCMVGSLRFNWYFKTIPMPLVGFFLEVPLAIFMYS